MNYTFTSWDSELYHHGIKGQKWGIRRYQNEDGTLTEAGKQRYSQALDTPTNKNARFLQKIVNKNANKADVSLYSYLSGTQMLVNNTKYYERKYGKKNGVVTTDDGHSYILFPKKIEEKLSKQKIDNLKALAKYVEYRQKAFDLLKDPRVSNYKVSNIEMQIFKDGLGLPNSQVSFNIKRK